MSNVKTESCPACRAAVELIPGAGFLVCDACGLRFPRPRKRGVKSSAAGDPMGIHPALARRHRARKEPTGSIQVTPSLTPESMPQNAAALGQTKSIRMSAEPRPSEPAKEAPKNTEDMPQLPGLTLHSQVGKGAMGQVYHATDNDTGAKVAVKVLAKELASRRDFIARFEREAAALARVRHPCVVSTLRSGRTVAPGHIPAHVAQNDQGTFHFLCMEFVDGASLRRSLEKGALHPLRALRFARQIVQGLGAVHEVGVIHRDLKPENILVTKSGDDERLVLVDFGLAGILNEDEDPHPNLTKSRMTMGTVNYMAPEQRTDAKRVDHRADLYASGVILYELLTGDLPLGRFALPTERGQILPTSVDDCVVKALARTPEERYQSAAEFDEALEKIEVQLRGGKQQSQAALNMAHTTTRITHNDAEKAETVVSPPHPSVPESESTQEIKRQPQSDISEWHTQPPWSKRPEFLWGGLALLVGALVAIFFSPANCAESSPEPTELSAPE